MKNQTNNILPIEIELEGVLYSGEAVALGEIVENMPKKFSVMLNRKIYFHIECANEGWHVIEDETVPVELANAVGDYLFEYYN